MVEGCFYGSRFMVDQMETVMFVYLSLRKTLTSRVPQELDGSRNILRVHAGPSSVNISELANTGEDAVLNADDATSWGPSYVICKRGRLIA